MKNCGLSLCRFMQSSIPAPTTLQQLVARNASFGVSWPSRILPCPRMKPDGEEPWSSAKNHHAGEDSGG